MHSYVLIYIDMYLKSKNAWVADKFWSYPMQFPAIITVLFCISDAVVLKD